MERASLITVAREAGVSKTTASLILNGKADTVHIARATQQHVKEVAQKLNYQPAIFNPGRLNGKTGIIGVLAEDYTGIRNATWLHFLSQMAEKQSYVIVPKISTNDNAATISNHLPTDGFILLNQNMDVSTIEAISRNGKVVCAGFQTGTVPSVIPDYPSLIKKMITALYRHNKKAIGYMDIDKDTPEQKIKTDAYKENYCQRFDIPENIVLLKDTNPQNISKGCIKLLQNGANGILFGSGQMAEKAMAIETIRNTGIKGVVFASPDQIAGQHLLPEGLLVTSETDHAELAEKVFHILTKNDPSQL